MIYSNNLEKDLVDLYIDEINDATNYIFNSSIEEKFNKHLFEFYNHKYFFDIFHNKLNNYFDEVVHRKKLSNIIKKNNIKLDIKNFSFDKNNNNDKNIEKIKYDFIIFLKQLDVLYNEEKEAVEAYYNFLLKLNDRDELYRDIGDILKDEEIHYIEMSLFTNNIELDYLNDILTSSKILEFFDIYEKFIYNYFSLYHKFIKNKNIDFFYCLFVKMLKYYLYINRNIEFNKNNEECIVDSREILNLYMYIDEILYKLNEIKKFMEQNKNNYCGFYFLVDEINESYFKFKRE